MCAAHLISATMRRPIFLPAAKWTDATTVNVCSQSQWTELTCNKPTQLHDAFIGHASQRHEWNWDGWCSVSSKHCACDSSFYRPTRGELNAEYYYYYHYDLGTQVPGNKKKYVMQQKQVQKSNWNEPYSYSFKKLSRGKMELYPESKRRVAEIKKLIFLSSTNWSGVAIGGSRF